MMVLPGRQRTLTISLAVWIECTNVSDRQTDGQRDTGPQQTPRLRIASHSKNRTPYALEYRDSVRSAHVHPFCTGMQMACRQHVSIRYKIGPWLLCVTDKKPHVTSRSVSVPMTSSDLQQRDASLFVRPRLYITGLFADITVREQNKMANIAIRD